MRSASARVTVPPPPHDDPPKLPIVALEEENVDVAQQNAFVALERFRLGVSTSLELREVQRALIDAQSRRVTARFEAKAAEVDLLALSGLLLPG